MNALANLLPAPGQRGLARPAVRADRARLHADRRRDGDDQPRARLAVRARHVRGAVGRRAEARLVSRSCRPRTCALPVGTRYAIALFVAPLLVGIFGLLLELCLRRTYGRDPLYGLLLTFGAALVIEELIRVVWGSTEQQLPLPEAISGAFLLRRPDLFEVPLLRQRLRGAGDPGAVAVPREDAVRRDHQGRRARQRDGARARHQPAAAARRGVRARRRAGGARRRGDGADLGHSAARRRRCGRAGVPDHRARRRRLAVGRGDRRACWSAWSSGSRARMRRSGR